MMKVRSKSLDGLLILVVEDEVMVAMMLEDMLQNLGCSVALAGSIDEAMSIIQETTPDGVLLDMNIHGRKTITIAEELADRSVPFLLVTGYDVADGDVPLIKAAPRLQKPFSQESLSRRMEEVFSPPKSAPSHAPHP